MNFDEISRLREHHGAWRLIRSTHAPLVLSFLGGFFVEENHGATAVTELVTALEDELYVLQETFPGQFPRPALEYLNEWSDPERGWLRRFYPLDSDEVHYDATPAVEKAYRFVESLQQRGFVGTESRLHTLVDLLRQMVHGSEEDPELRLQELQRQRDEIDAEMARVRAGENALLDETGVRERYQLFASTARELLSDFREVEENFRNLDRSAREQIAGWRGSRGELLGELVSSRSNITSSDQGRSFQAFYDFLLSRERQEELTALLASVQMMPAVEADERLRFVHHDWAEAAERAQHTVRNLSEQLRRFLEDQVWIENRRVVDLVRDVEQLAMRVRNAPRGELSEIGLLVDEPGIPIELPVERPLYDPQPEVKVNSLIEPEPDGESHLDLLLTQRYIDTERLAQNLRSIIPEGTSTTLTEVIEWYPLEHGVAELLAYLALDEADVQVEIVDGADVKIPYIDADGVHKQVSMPETKVVRR